MTPSEAPLHFDRFHASERLGSIVAVHGLAESAETLHPIAREWQAMGYEVITVDQRGHGLSPRWDLEHLDNHPGDEMVQDLVGLFDRLEPDLPGPIIVFGHSAGGGVAAGLAAARSSKIRAVVLEDPFWRLPVTECQDRQVAIEAHRNLIRLQGLNDAERQAEQHRQEPQWPLSELGAWSTAKRLTEPAIVLNGDVIPSTPWPDLLARLKTDGVDVLIITGSDRIGILPEHQSVARERGARVAIVPGASHFVRRDRGREFSQIVNAFLDEIALPNKDSST